MQFACDESGYYVNDKGYIVAGAPSWLAAVLNSRLMHWVAQNLCSKLQHGWLELKADSVVGQLPLLEPDAGTQRPLRDIALGAASEEPLNDIVEGLYGISAGERRQLADWEQRQSETFGRTAEESGDDDE
jgi:hypothetical protein